MDAVVNLAFNHDLSKFAQNAADEISAIEALGSVLEPGKLLVVTSGAGIDERRAGPGAHGEAMPRRIRRRFRADRSRRRRLSRQKGVHVAIVRLPQVHDTRKQGLVPWLTQTAREKGVSAYVGDGANRWAAAPLKDVAHLYRLAVEKTGPGVTVYNAVQEEGVPATGDRGDDRQGAKGTGGFDRAGKGWRALWVACALRDAGYAGIERVDAQDAGMGADRARADRGSDEYEVFLIALPMPV